MTGTQLHRPRGFVRHLPGTALGLALLLVAPPPAGAAPAWFSKNDHVEVTGVVTAPSGQALDNLQVVLELIRETRDLRSLKKIERDRTVVSVTTDATGAFHLTSPWTRYYNHLELVVGLTVQGQGTERFQELERMDVTPRLRRGGAAVIPVVVANAAFVREYREFVANLSSADERKTFAERGRPDKVETLKSGPRRQTAWWYFATGQVCRFVDGGLVEVERFDPVAPIP